MELLALRGHACAHDTSGCRDGVHVLIRVEEVAEVIEEVAMQLDITHQCLVAYPHNITCRCACKFADWVGQRFFWGVATDGANVSQERGCVRHSQHTTSNLETRTKLLSTIETKYNAELKP